MCDLVVLSGAWVLGTCVDLYYRDYHFRSFVHYTFAKLVVNQFCVGVHWSRLHKLSLIFGWDITWEYLDDPQWHYKVRQMWPAHITAIILRHSKKVYEVRYG